MDDENSTEYYNDYTGSKYVTRRRRNKKNRKSKQNQTVILYQDDARNDSENSNNLESIVNSEDENRSDKENDQSCGSGTTNTSAKDDYRTYNNIVSVDAVGYVQSKFVESSGQVYCEQFEQSPPVTELQDNEVKINTRALSKYASTYELEKFEKNAMIIFNHKDVIGEEPRLGTEKDADALTNTFQNYGFEVVTHNDFTKDEIFKELKIFSKRDFTDYGCVGVAVLTHGSHHGLLRAKDQEYSETDIINCLKVKDNPSLVTKPKYLIIQACRGTKTMQGVGVNQCVKTQENRDESLEHYVLPLEADMLVLHSSYIGKPANRNKVKGSWFIQTLCKKINQFAATHDLESIFTEVKHEVAIKKYNEQYNTNTRAMEINKQMPVMTSTLVRQLHLKKFEDAAPLETLSDNILSMSSKNDFLDVGCDDTPITPLARVEPCLCFLDHFNYIRNCLRYFSKENPDDEVAQTYLVLANTYKDVTEFNNCKEIMTKVICKHLRNKANNCRYFKYLYFYRHEN